MPERERVGRIAATWLRVLTFRASHEELASIGSRHLEFGLFATWLAGVGRYWDNPKANLLQHLGLGSLAYIVALAALLYIAIRPLGPHPAFTYRNLLTWLSLCSLPALLYALPVERWTGIETARQLNVTFLSVVAGWRVVLLAAYLRRLCRFGVVRIAVAALLPLTAIVTALALLNVEHAVFEIMGGLDPTDPYGPAYVTVLLLAFGAIHVFPVAMLAWIWIAVSEAASDRRSEPAKVGGGP